MRDLLDSQINKYRLQDARVMELYGWPGDETCGAFRIPSPVDKAVMTIIASSDLGWDHVSISRTNRPPNWTEMEHIKRLFFKDDETAMQLHVPPAKHINLASTTLHLWRPQNQPIPMPPTAFV